MNPKEIEPKDSKGRYHGYHEWYFSDNMLWLRTTFNHGKFIGYDEDHRYQETSFYII